MTAFRRQHSNSFSCRELLHLIIFHWNCFRGNCSIRFNHLTQFPETWLRRYEKHCISKFNGYIYFERMPLIRCLERLSWYIRISVYYDLTPNSPTNNYINQWRLTSPMQTQCTQSLENLIFINDAQHGEWSTSLYQHQITACCISLQALNAAKRNSKVFPF